MRFRSILVIGLLSSLLVLSACATRQELLEPVEQESYTGVVEVKPAEPIHIACWMILSGPDAGLGIDTKRGVEIALDDRGGKLVGHSVKLTFVDTDCNSESGRVSATKIARDRTVVVAIGPNCSSSASSGVPILWTSRISTVSPSNSSPQLTDSSRTPNYDGYLRTSHNDRVQSGIAAEFIFRRLGLKRVATIPDRSRYGELVEMAFVEAFQNFGGTVVARESIDSDGKEAKPVLDRIVKAEPEALFLAVFTTAGSQIVRQVKEIPSLKRIALVSTDGMFGPDLYLKAGMSAVGVYHTAPNLSYFTPEYNRFLEKHQKKYRESPIGPFHACAYDAAMMVFAAIEKVALNAPDGSLSIDRKALRDALYATRKMKGVTGTLTCTPTGDCSNPKIEVYKTGENNVRSMVLPTEPFWRPN